ncbi:hypothetical protein [Geopseudomonas aromaticivorans]
MRTSNISTIKKPVALFTVITGLIAILHGALTLAMVPAATIGLWGISEAAWAGGAISSGLAALAASYFAFWRSR